MKMGPTLTVSDQVHSEKYRGGEESFRDAVHRIAGGMSTGESHFYQLKDLLSDMAFLPGGRIQAAVGSTRKVTALNCYVGRDIEDSMEGIMTSMSELAMTLRQGGGWGSCFSTLRPKNDIISSLGSNASGPVSFMGIANAVCETIKSAGHRRGAMMATFRVDHPNIEDFISAKAVPPEVAALWDLVASLPDKEVRRKIIMSTDDDQVKDWLDGMLPTEAQVAQLKAALQHTLKLTNFNVSVSVTDAFMHAVRDDSDFDLTFEGKKYSTVRARDLWQKIMRNTWDWAEPGILFIDAIQRMNNLWYCEDISATNPCGEQPLPPFGACLLGSQNLVRYVTRVRGNLVFDYERFRADVRPIVEGLDNVIDSAVYPLEQQRIEETTKRRMGLGVTGVANALEALGHQYGSHQFCVELDRILTIQRDAAYEASCDLAEERGSFAAFDSEQYLKSGFIATLPKTIQDRIASVGIRNSHLLSIAPTGTISFSADNVSSGIEPVFSYEYERKTFMADGTQQTFNMQDYGYARFGVHGKRSSECTIKDHLDVLRVAARNVDSAVSKTLNVGPNITFADFGNVYFEAWEMGAKGCTTFRPNGKRSGVLTEKAPKDSEAGFGQVVPFSPDGESCYQDPNTGQRVCGD